RSGQAYNEDGQKIDEQGDVLPEIAEGVDRHHQGVARHQGGYRAAAVADGRAIPLGDYNYANRYSCSSYQAHPPLTSANLNARINREDVSIVPSWTERNLTTACHAVLMEEEAEFVEIEEKDAEFVVVEVVSTDTSTEIQDIKL
ncbi:unnamed protein product, partial [Arabidopsis halleri]